MKTLRKLFKPMNRPLPDDTQCSQCRYFDTSDPRVVQTIKEEFPHNWSNVLYSARCKCDDMFHAKQVKQKSLWNESNLPNRHGNSLPNTFDTFKEVKGVSQGLSKAMSMAYGRGSHILTIVGTYGCGKSHLLEAVAREWLHRGESVRYEYVPSMLNQLRSRFSSEDNGSLWTALEEIFKVKLLVLDDLGQEAPTEWTRKTLTEIVDERIRTDGWLLCATNYTQDQLRERLDERFVSRLFDRADFVVMTSSSYREKK